MNFNKVIFGGRLTRDVDFKTLQGGTAVANIGVAVNVYRRNADGESESEGHFFDAEAYEKQAELLRDHYSKGSAIMFEGSLRQDRWQDDNGNNRSRVKIRIQRIVFLPRDRSDEESDDSGDDDRGSEVGF